MRVCNLKSREESGMGSSREELSNERLLAAISVDTAQTTTADNAD